MLEDKRVSDFVASRALAQKWLLAGMGVFLQKSAGMTFPDKTAYIYDQS